jgi:hypothetical protein
MAHGRLIRSYYPILLDRLAPATDVTAGQARRCRLWVKRVGFVMSAVCLVYPKQQTFPDPVGTSHLCQQQKWLRSFDDLVRARNQRWWEAEVERLGGLQVDDQRNFRRLLHRKLTRRGAI